MGFGLGGVWVMGYSGPMGYGMQFPANQLGGWLKLWDLRGYGLSGVWVKRDSTVFAFFFPGTSIINQKGPCQC